MTLATLTSLFLTFQYPIIFLLTIVEGPVIMMMSGLLIRLGTASFWPLYLVLMAGDLTADVTWYFVGKHFAHPVARRYGRFIGVTEALLDKLSASFKKHSTKILVLSKLTTGFGFAPAVLMTAGMTRVPFKKYFLINTIGQFFWTAFLIGIGYFFGDFYTYIDQDLRVISVIGFAVVAFFAVRGFSVYLRSRKFEDILSR